MKFLILLVAALAIAQAERDWSQIKVREITRNARRPVFGSRVVGGDEATPHEFPHQAALFIDTPEGTFFCGATLIAPKYVLTAAHCADGALSIEVILGAHNIRQSESTQVSIKVPQSNIHVHEGWNTWDLSNDLALLELSQEAPLNKNIAVLPLNPATEGQTLVGELATVSGWGKDSDFAGGISPVLRKASMPIMSNKDCNSVYGNIGNGQICTDSSQGRGSCNGDSGGPLTVQLGGTLSQVGIVSFGSAAGCSSAPSAYTRVSEYINWIQGKMN